MADASHLDAARAQGQVRPRRPPPLALVCVLLLGSCNCSRGAKPTPQPSASKANQAASTPATRSEYNKTSPVGTNLSGIADWSSEIPFIDLFKSSRPWISGTISQWDDGATVSVDEHGWVRELRDGQVARTLMLWDVKRYPAGKYLVLYDGEGEITYASSAANELLEEESKPGRHVLDVDPERGSQAIHLIIEKTDPKNPIRNIRVLLPGGTCEQEPLQWCDIKHPCGAGACIPFEQSHDKLIFNPEFLKELRAYSLIRFMDWGATNDSTVSRWSERPLLTDARWSIKGAPVEIMIELVHRLQADAWFNIPHRADDDYVRNMASLVHKRLKPGHRAWVEFSNEVWNGQFEQHREVRGCPEGANTDSTYHAGLLCYAQRAKRVLAIWGEVFANDSSRLVRVIASQSANPWSSEQILEHKDTVKHADALAIAPYFGTIATPENEEAVEKLSVEQLLAEAKSDSIPSVLKHVREHQDIAKEHDLQLVAYEGGQHLVGVSGVENNEKLNALFDAANRHPKMGELYDLYLKGWKDAGGRLFVNYTSCDPYTKWGRFGALEYLGQSRKDAPKFDSIHRFIENNPRWW